MVRARLLVLAAAALALAGCSAEPASEPAPPIDGGWLLTSATGADGDLDLGESPVTLSIAADLYSGTGPCNSYTGSLDDSGDFPRFSPVASTRMACEPEAVMQLEADYFAALEAVDGGTVEDDTLTLTGGGGVELVFETWDSATVEETELDGEWQFTGGSDADGDIVVNGVPVTLLLSQGAVSGQAPCNTYTGALSDDNGTLFFAPIAQTLMACADDALTDLEARYLAALQSSTTGTVDGETLTLSSPETSLEFTLLPRQSVD
jgi:heat shock protein HslJ